MKDQLCEELLVNALEIEILFDLLKVTEDREMTARLIVDLVDVLIKGQTNAELLKICLTQQLL